MSKRKNRASKVMATTVRKYTRFIPSRSRWKKSIPLITFTKRDRVDNYLKEYNIDLDKGDYRCMVCGERVTKKNLGILIYKDGTVLVVCNKKSCMEKAYILSF